VHAGYSGKTGIVVFDQFPVFPNTSRVPVKFDHDDEVLWIYESNLKPIHFDIELADSLGYLDEKNNHRVGDMVIMKGGAYKGHEARIVEIGHIISKAETYVELVIDNGDEMTYLLTDTLFQPKED